MMILYAFLILFHSAFVLSDANSTLELVHIIFRHGDRTTDKFTIYPKDPHINETYYPYGLGELTKKGKQTAYQLGKELRERFSGFLGPYTPDLIEALSSPYNRTKASLQLVLAGLFPPQEEEIFEPGLLWQPIPYTHMAQDNDRIFLSLLTCSQFKKKFGRFIKSKKIQQEFKQVKSVFDYVSEHSGLKVESYLDLLLLYVSLKTEEEWGLKLPEWTQKVYPEKLQSLVGKAFGILTGTTELRRIAVGYFFKKIVDDTSAKIAGHLSPQTRKVFLYSGHDLNIASILSTLEVPGKELPPYGSYMSFELHKLDGVYGFKVYYQDRSSTEPKLLKLPACEEFCPFGQFVSLVEEYFPGKNTCEMQKPCTNKE